jgi:hypothetical protein
VAVGDIDSVELSLRSKCEDCCVGDYRCSTRSLVESEVVSIFSGVLIAPQRRAGARVERVEHFVAVETMEQEQAVAGDDRSCESFTDGLSPDSARSAGRPGLGERRSAIDPVSLRPKMLRPVGRVQARNQE